MSRIFLLAVVMAILFVLSAADSSSSSSGAAASSSSSVAQSTGVVASSTGSTPTQTFCQKYSGTTTDASIQIALLTNITVRAVVGGVYTSPSNVVYVIPGLFNASGPLYSIFTGQTQYRANAPDYVHNNASLGVLAGKLVAYFGALFGCTATGYPAVSQYNMYAVHANMSINSTQQNYFNTQLADTLRSFGVLETDVVNTAAPALGLFNRCGAPIAALSPTAPVQVCGTSDCQLATGATDNSCYQYYSSSSSTGVGSNDATIKSALSVVSILVAAVVASLVL